MVFNTAPLLRFLRLSYDAMMAYIKNSASSFSGSHIQLQKCWLVAIGRPRMVTKPTEASRHRHTVPVGRSRAAEFAKPALLVYSAVSYADFPCNLRMSGNASHGTLPPHHS